ncbi:MAG: hypothetical protein ACR2NJ_07030 [Acidimicrobiales bacterium]
MAEFRIEGDELVLHLRPREKFWAFHGDVRVPLSAVRSVSTPKNAWLALRGWRMAGTGIPSVIALGTRRHGTGYDFTAVRKAKPAVLVEANAGRFEQIIASVADPEGTAAEIRRAAGIK